MIRPTTAMSATTLAELNRFIEGRRTTRVACLEGFYVPFEEQLVVIAAVMKSEAELTKDDILKPVGSVTSLLFSCFAPVRAGSPRNEPGATKLGSF